jgi:ribosome-binding ATPase YchF (GTP1/OBG family)
MKLFDRFLGRSALSRAEALIAEKRDEISRVTKAQLDDIRSIQKEIDLTDVKIVELRKSRKRLETKAEAAMMLNRERLAQLAAELDELTTNEASLKLMVKNQEDASKPTTYSIGEDGVMVFTSGRKFSDEKLD